MKIRSVQATWLHAPIPPDKQHTTDFGRIASFDSTLVRIETAGGLVGYGEAKAAVGSAGTNAALCDIVIHSALRQCRSAPLALLHHAARV